MKLSPLLIKRTIAPFNSIKYYHILYKNTMLGISDDVIEDYTLTLLLSNSLFNGLNTFALKKKQTRDFPFSSKPTNIKVSLLKNWKKNLLSYFSEYSEESPYDVTNIITYKNVFEFSPNNYSFLTSVETFLTISDSLIKTNIYVKARFFFYNYKINSWLFYIISKQFFSLIKLRIARFPNFFTKTILYKKMQIIKKRKKNIKKKNKNLIKFLKKQIFSEKLLMVLDIIPFIKKIKHLYIIPIKKFKESKFIISDIHSFFISFVYKENIRVISKLDVSKELLELQEFILTSLPLRKKEMTLFDLEDLILSKKKQTRFFSFIDFGYSVKSKTFLLNNSSLNILLLKRLV